MAAILLQIIGLSAIIAIPAQSVVLGLNAGMPYLKELLTKKKIILKYIVTMFVITPLIAVVFNYFFQDFRSLWIAVLVISLNPASPGMIKNITKLGGDPNISTIWMIFTIFLSIIFVPINLLILENILNMNIELGITDVIVRLSLLFLIPMGIGFYISEYKKKYSDKLKKILSNISKVAMLVLMISLLVTAMPSIISKGPIPILLLLAFIITALIVSVLMSNPGKKNGSILSYSIILRLPAPAIILSQLNNTVEQHMPVIISYTILGTLVMMVYNKIFIIKQKN